MLRGIIGLDYMRKRGLLLEQVKVFVGFRVKRSFFESVIVGNRIFRLLIQF